MLQELVAGELWHAVYPIRFAGMSVTARMSVARVGDSQLWVHSPGPLDDTLAAQLDALGKVTFICAPNRFHHLFAGPFRQRYPSARLFGAPGLARKRPDLQFDGTLTVDTKTLWTDALEHLLFEGMPLLNEVVFLHRASRTLLLTDLCAWYAKPDSVVKKAAARLLGVDRQMATARTIRFMVRDRQAARRSRDQILEWDFERIVLAHEDIVPQNGKTALHRALSWLDARA